MSKYNKITSLEYSDFEVNTPQTRNLISDDDQQVLDMFDHCLTEEETEKWNFEYRDHNLRYEHRYLALFEDLFELNGSKVMMKFDFKEIEVFELVNIIDGLDQREKMDFLEIMRNQKLSLTSKFYMIEDLELISLFGKLMTRELYPSMELHFVNIGLSISGGYDLSFPVCLKNEELRGYVEIIIRKHKLFIR